MNKRISFLIAFVVATLVFIEWGESFHLFGAMLSTTRGTNFFIYWFMIWKLLHDKNKD